MSKISLDRLTSQFGFQAAFNSVLKDIEDEFSNRVLYRDNPAGENNSMNNDIDMAGNDLINVGTISASDFRVNGQDLSEAVSSLVDQIDDAIDEANTAVIAAEGFADEAEDWANTAQVAATTVAYNTHEGTLLEGGSVITLPWPYDVNVGVEVFLSGVKQAHSNLVFPNTTTVALVDVVSEDTPYEVVSTSRASSQLGTQLSDPNGSALVGFLQSGTGAEARTVQSKLRDVVSVKDFGATGDGVTDDTAAIQEAVDTIGDIGGGTIYFPAGTYLVSNGNPSATSWDNDVAIWVKHDGVNLLGAGRGATVIKLANGSDAHVIKFGQRVTTTVVVSDCSVQSMEIDGNRDNQTMPAEAVDHWQGIDVASGCSRIVLRDLYIHDTPYYGIGMQRDAITDSTIENVVIEDTGADGIDWKNDSGNGVGNHIKNVTVRRWGKISGLTAPQAAIDVRSGVSVSGIYVEGMTGDTGIVGVRTQGDNDATSTGIAKHPPSVENVTIIGDNRVNSVGLRITTRNTSVRGAMVKACSDGVRLSRPDCELIGVHAVNNTASGIRLTVDGSTALEADTCSIIGSVVRDNSTAGIIYDSVDEINVVGVEVRNNGVGHDIRSGSSNIRVIGGSCTGNTTNVSDLGTVTYIRHVSGFRTYTTVKTSVAIDSTGVKSFVIPHGLAFTPSIEDVTLQLLRKTNVGDWSAGFLWTTSADATNINGQIRVLTASATSGATVDVVAIIDSKNG